MGAHLVQQAFAVGAMKALKPNEFRLLTYMALTALDAGDPPLYFAGRERSARALGRLVPDEPRSDDPDADAKRAERRAAFQAVKVAASGLQKAGVIRCRASGRHGRNAEFELALSMLGQSEDSDGVR